MVGTPTKEEEWRQAEALMIWRRHGLDAPDFIAGRMVALALADDVDGVVRFQQIAVALNDLMKAVRH